MSDALNKISAELSHIAKSLESASTMTIEDSDTAADTVSSFIEAAAKKVFFRSLQDTTYEGSGLWAVSISEDDYNGEQYRDFEFIVNTKSHNIKIVSYGKVLGVKPLDLWGATVHEVATVMKALSRSVPRPSSGGDDYDTPSLQDTAPLEYFTER